MSRVDIEAVKARADAATAAWGPGLPSALADSAADVPVLIAALADAESEIAWWDEHFPCDSDCMEYPEEDCSQHGRKPADLWAIINRLEQENAALRETCKASRGETAGAPE